VDAHLHDAVRANPVVKAGRADLEAGVREGRISAVEASERILRDFLDR